MNARIGKEIYCVTIMLLSSGRPLKSPDKCAFSGLAEPTVEGIPMSHMSSGARFFLTVAAATFVLSCYAGLSGGGQSDELTARASAADDPVAVISPLPDYVSNGTWWSLDASQSIGVIKLYTWNVTVGGVTTFLYAQSETFMFKTLGLYKITLTVEDNQSRFSQAFTAVVSVLDSDQDSLPDWWELHYFKNLNEIGTGDYDGDKYTNLEEYATGTDPTKKDPRPTFVQMVKENWIVALVIVAAIVGAILALMPFLKKRRKVMEKHKIEAAIEIEKALEEEGK